MTEAAFTVDINGVEVGFRDMTPGQITMATLVINKARKDARKIGEAQASVAMLGSILNLVESLIIEEADREHLLESMLTGELDIDIIYTVLRRGAPVEPDDDEDVARPVKLKKRNPRAAA